MTTQQDTIFVQGLPTEIDERSLEQFFGQIGVIKVNNPDVFLHPTKSINYYRVVESVFFFMNLVDQLQNDRKTGMPKIWIYKNKQTGLPKGEATITYDDAYTATSAIEWFNSKFNIIFLLGLIYTSYVCFQI